VAVLKKKLRFQELCRSKEARPSIQNVLLIRRSFVRFKSYSFILLSCKPLSSLYMAHSKIYL